MKPKGAPEAPSAIVPFPEKEGDRDAQASPARASSRVQVEPAGASSAPLTQATPEVPLLDAASTAVVAQLVPSQGTLVSLPSSPPTPSTAASPNTVLDCAIAGLDRLRQDLPGADPRLVVGRLELASGWIRSDASIRAALVHASSACDEEKQAALEAKVARDAALREAASVRGRCETLESELKGLQN